MEKIWVKLNKEKGATFFQDPTNENNLIQGSEIKEFHKTPHVQGIIDGRGLIQLHKEDKEVKDYLEKLKNEPAKPVEEPVSKSAEKKIAKLEEKVKDAAELHSQLKDNFDKVEYHNKELQSDLATANARVKELEEEVKTLKKK